MTNAQLRSQPLNMDPKILTQEVIFSSSLSSGAGGQHVNRTESKATATWHLASSRLLTAEQKERLAQKLTNQINSEGYVSVSSQMHRSLLRNKQDCLVKLSNIIAQGLFVPKKRKKTKPTRSSQMKRVDSKKKRGEVKSLRQKKDW